VSRPEDADGLAERIVSEFDRNILGQYEPEDRRRGYIELPDRTGRLRRFPPVSLTVAVVVEQQNGLPTPRGGAKYGSPCPAARSSTSGASRSKRSPTCRRRTAEIHALPPDVRSSHERRAC
jgi:hypothetical protein